MVIVLSMYYIASCIFNVLCIYFYCSLFVGIILYQLSCLLYFLLYIQCTRFILFILFFVSLFLQQTHSKNLNQRKTRSRTHTDKQIVADVYLNCVATPVLDLQSMSPLNEPKKFWYKKCSYSNKVCLSGDLETYIILTDAITWRSRLFKNR